MAEANASKQIKDLMRRLTKLGQGGTLKVIAAKLGTKGLALAQAAVASHESPTGRKWKTRKRDKGAALPGLAGSLSMSPRGLGFNVVSSAAYALFHQAGAKKKPGGLRILLAKALRVVGIKTKMDRPKWKLPKRAILPTRTLPKRWAEPFFAIADKTVRELFKL